MSEPQRPQSFFASALGSPASTTPPPAGDRSREGFSTKHSAPPVVSDKRSISPETLRPNQPSIATAIRGTASPVPSGLPAVVAGSSIARQPYKSFRKKYRKLRLRFDTVMRENEELEGKDFAAKSTIRRLNAENARLLDMLIDLSESPHVNKQFQVGGLGIEEVDEERGRQAKVLKWIIDAGAHSVTENGEATAEVENEDGGGENHSENRETSGKQNGSNNGNANATESGVDGKRLRRPSTPQYLKDEILLLQDDYDSDF
ncbi:IEC3 subunit of the Ino80 complex, chromatin re-modelling-domain-containing protein [Lipomyces orientalis]|uniref:IEC3 subunit of the Ino80 complex, chromatin re-modelling-domain-containing protein n=1 Tax=Lipomyces orientalis TaxID=1233043 RepID=A0ACC3TV85_9ASCO